MIVNNKDFVVRQSSKLNTIKKNYYDWSIWIEGGTRDLSEIDAVEYLLHSTFKNRLREREDITDGFLLQSSGWGEFEIRISIHLKSGQIMYRTHWLTLGEDYTNGPENYTDGVEEEDDTLKKIYISYSSPDIKKAIQVQDMLKDLGLEVVSGMDMNSNSSVSDFVKLSMEDSDLVLNIDSINQNDWQKEEHRIAQQLSKKIVSLDDDLDSKQLEDLVNHTSKSNNELYNENLKTLKNKLNE